MHGALLLRGFFVGGVVEALMGEVLFWASSFEQNTVLTDLALV